MKNTKLLLRLAALLLAIGLILAGCSGKKEGAATVATAPTASATAVTEATASAATVAAPTASAVKAPYELLTNPALLRDAVFSVLTASESGVKKWEDEVTETTADKAAGYIVRGKFNLRVSGPMSQNELAAVYTASKEMAEGQLLRLDLSGTTGLQELPVNAFYDGYSSPHLGSIILPEGIKTIEANVFYDQKYLIEAVLPDSLERIEMNAFHGTALPKLLIPVKVAIYNGGILHSSVDCVVVFKDGRGSADLQSFGDRVAGISFTRNIYGEITGGVGDGPTTGIIFVFPPSFKEFTNSGIPYELVNEIYSYAETPPVYKGTQQMVFKNAKTVYVPQSAVAAYTDAWFNITGAEFKPLPAGIATIEKWY
jgi:hypothetical protein